MLATQWPEPFEMGYDQSGGQQSYLEIRPALDTDRSNYFRGSDDEPTSAVIDAPRSND